jgi:hypothetical protein
MLASSDLAAEGYMPVSFTGSCSGGLQLQRRYLSLHELELELELTPTVRGMLQVQVLEPYFPGRNN